MPWKNRNSYGFTRDSIHANAPARSGVYGLFAQQWVYIGEAEDIRARLLGHLAGDDECVARHRPNGFVFETWPASLRAARRQELVQEFQPLCLERAPVHPATTSPATEGV